MLYFVGLFTSPIKAQQVYLSATAKASIEPKAYPFSVALAGYGYPRGGRFSLDWIKTNMKVEKVFPPARKQHLKWKKWIGNAIAFTIFKKIIYTADRNGTIIYTALEDRAPVWKKLPAVQGITSLSAYKGRLFALTSDDELLQLELGGKNRTWVRIARFNGLTYDIHLKAITTLDGKLYGLDQNNVVFEGHHKTEGNLSVSAVAISAAKETVLLVGADVCGFNNDFIAEVKGEILKKHHILPSAILINASHTHFAPSTQDWTTWGAHQLPDSVYLNQVVKPALINVIHTAIKNRKPSILSFGRAKTTIGKNRSLEGTAASYDDDVDVLTIERKKDHKKTAIFLTGCHPVFKNEGIGGYTLSANYPGITRNILEKEAGITDALFMQGCGGDINPVSVDYKKTGNELATVVKGILNAPMQQLTGNITFYLDSLNFPVKKWSDERIQAFKTVNDNGKGDVEAEKDVRWADLMLGLSKNNKVPVNMPVYIQTINIGNWKLVGLSREAVTDYSIGIKQLWPGELVSVAGYCNDVSSYLPTSKHIQSATYEGLGSFFWYGQPSVFPLDVYEKIISTIKTKNH
ncbi:hypothetical protein FA048_15915 [Pedobacter polaris]|uniref:Neutral/alkaline non-lysosomal ceramidase N-terminal domain-containing protein n=1 Tax=Pedobacter polaris TaxID=2571273 RepID=A0A4U1CKH9_9SPHI|nr:hypothetical protein [Pedobacter polaris]TKC06689.1 hypothetical protein FA048_15915 [Pedobacter polaris]